MFKTIILSGVILLSLNTMVAANFCFGIAQYRRTLDVPEGSTPEEVCAASGGTVFRVSRDRKSVLCEY